MTRASALAALALVAGSCAIRDARTSGGPSGQPCSNDDQCESNVCFLGECRNPSASLSFVHAEVRSSDARFGTLQTAGIDLRKTPVADFTLQRVLAVSGRVMQQFDPPNIGNAPVPGATVVFTDLAPAIPDRAVRISVQSDTGAATAGTYTASLPGGIYDVLVAPLDQPVTHPFGPISSSSPNLDLVLPAKASFTQVQGILIVNATDPLAGAQVSAVDASGTSIGVAQVSAANGSFALDLPPGPPGGGAPAFTLQVGPAASASANDPVPTFNAQSFAAGHALDLGNVSLGTLPPTATLTGKVVDARGAPVASARVLALSSGATGYVLSRQAITDGNGSFSVVVRAGSYLVEAAPDTGPSTPAVSDATTVNVVAPSTDLGTPVVCPDKVRVTGTVLRADGRPANAGFGVAATRVPDQLVAGRTSQSSVTDASGSFALVLDRGPFRIEIVPTVESALPRTILTVDVPAGGGSAVTLASLRIAPPHEVLGTIFAGSQTVRMPGATVDFYAMDASGKRSVLIGTVIADSSGQYKAVLPDVVQPAPQ